MNYSADGGIEFLKQVELPWAYRKELDDCIFLLEQLTLKRKNQNKIIEQLCRKTPQTKILMTLPGIGYNNALLILSEIGNVNRFPDGEHFASYCGLVTSVHISDNTVRYGHITKEGNSWLRWIYTEDGHFARRHLLRFGNLYE